MPFKATWVAPGMKFVPVRVTAVPTGPPVGVNELIVGGVEDPVSVNVLALTPVPAVVVTLRLPVVAPLGTLACIWVSESTVTRVAGVPFKATWVAPVTKLVPVRVTAVPTGPLVGVNDVIVGGVEDPVSVNVLALTPVPAVVVTLILPVVAPLGTVA